MKCLLFKLISFLLIVGVGSVEGWSLNPQKTPTQYHLEIWKAARGLSRKLIVDILQTSQGYIWIGTLEGLICFDGIRFRVFDTNNTPQIKNNRISALYETDDGKLLIGTGSGLVCLNNGKFTSSPFPSAGVHFNQKHVRCITGDPAGNLWVGTMGHGLFRLNKRGEKIASFTTKDGLSHNIILDIRADSGGRLWIGTMSGLDLLEKGKLSHLPINKALSGTAIFTIFEDREKNLWFGTQTDLIKLAGEEMSNYPTGNIFPSHSVITIFEDRRRNLWFGTDGGGLYWYGREKENEIFTAFTSKYGLSDNYVHAIFEDQEGSLWIGTINGGLNRLKDTPFTTFSTVEGLSNDMVLCVFEDSKGMIWIGTKGGGVNCLSLKNGKAEWNSFTTENGLCSNIVYSIEEDHRGNTWIGTDNGLNWLNRSDFSRPNIKKELEGTSVSCLYEDRAGNLWIGTIKRKLLYLKEGQLKTAAANKELPPHQIKCMLEDSSGGLWIGTFGGGIIRLKDGAWSHYSIQEGLSSKRIWAFYQDREGTLWIGTNDGGLIRFKDGKFVSRTTTDGFFISKINQVLEDNEGNIWLSSDNGIFRVEKKVLNDFFDGNSNTVDHSFYNEAHGMKSRICNGGWQPSGCIGRDGRLWFPTIKGVVVVDPANIKKNTLIPPVKIEEIIVDNEEVKAVFEPVSPVEVTFSPGTKKFEFHYTALSFLEPQKVRFKYKLEGFESQWNDVGPRRAAYYTNIPPGHYTFKVTACNNDGLWNTIGTSFTFYLKPYFYQTTRFYILAALFVFLAAFLGYHFRMRQLIAREKKLSQLVDMRTNALNERTLELENSKQVIEKKNQNILSSIQYARRIQHAILPSDERLKSLIKDYFVLFNPRDIVSGDIYWFNQDRDLFFIAVVDCTGHGVPGALLSMIGNMKLNELISDWGISEPAQMLSHLHLGVRQALHQEKETSMTHDGMEVALCMIDIKQNKLSFAGAKRPLYYSKDSQFFEIKGDRKPIGGAQKEKDRQFTTHEIDIDPDIIIYLTTDGFADQNDVKNKKYGSKQLKQFLLEHAHLGMKQQKEALLEELKRHQGTEEQRDDITIIGIKLENKKIAG